MICAIEKVDNGYIVKHLGPANLRKGAWIAIDAKTVLQRVKQILDKEEVQNIETS